MAKPESEEKHAFIESVANGLTEALAELFDNGPQGVLAAVSGGADSTALLVSLAQICRENGWQLKACHINHGLRGAESEQDQEFCEKLCSTLNIPLSVIPLNLGDEWRGNNRPPENMLRELRYGHLLVNAQEQDCDVVVTGHTLDDQAETILFRLLRGTSPTGLVGMEEHRELIENEGVHLVRPMLKLTKLDCLRFLASKQLGSRMDSSNEDAHYARNFIRTKLVPLIDEKFPGWQSRIERFRTIVAEQEEFLECATEAAFDCLVSGEEDEERLSIDRFQLIEPALKRRIIVKLMKEREVEPSFERIDAVLQMIEFGTDSAISLSSSCEVRLDRGYIAWLNPEDAEDDEPSTFMKAQETALRLPSAEKNSCSNIIAWLNKSLRVEAWQADSRVKKLSFPKQNELELLADLSKIHEPIVVRMRRPGDFIQPFGMNEKVRLKKYLHTHKAKTDHLQPFNQNLSHAIVLANDSEVLWVPGVGISEKLRVTEKPSHRLIWLDLSSGGGSIIA